MKERSDFVRFRLKQDAPDYVAIVRGRRFEGVYRRAEEPFEATRGEWIAFLAPMGRFEEISHGDTETQRNDVVSAKAGI